MATQAQIDANRRNARKSTGPRTEQGKRTVASNAVKHGVFSEEAVIRGENPAEFAAFADELRQSLEESHGLMNVLLVERIIRLEWKLLRLPRLEKLALDQAIGEEADADAALLGAIAADDSVLMKLERYEMRLARELRACKRRLDNERKMHSARELHRAYAEGFNEGVRREGESQHRPEPHTPLREVPEAGELDIDRVVTDDAVSDTEPAEQSQFCPNDRQGEELATAAPDGDGAEPSPYPLPEYRERDHSDAA